MDALAFVASLVVLLAVVFVIVRRVDTTWHDSFCTCERCRTKAIRTEVQRREWHQQRDEIEAAVSELFKDVGKRRPPARPGRGEES